MRLFWLGESASVGQRIILNIQDSHRLLHVLRLKLGESFTARDEPGNIYQVTLDSIEQKLVRLRVTNKLEASPPQPEIILWQALPKQQRFTQTIQLAIESGVTHIVPMMTAHTQGYMKDSLDKADRWWRVALEAVDQSGNKDFRSIGSVSKLDDLLARKGPGLGFFCHQDSMGSCKLSQILREADLSQPIILAIGPEGGFSQEEVSVFTKNAFHSLCFYDTILRSENAGMFFLAALKMMLQENKELYGEVTRPTC